MGTRIDGVLLVDKKSGESSYDIVRKTRKALKVNKVGHAGTLDPFATGLLVVLIGQGTKLAQFILGTEKTYVTRIRLGVETDTLDPTGKIIREEELPPIGAAEIEEAVKSFIGVLEQIPPIYSAVKVNGKRAYEIARAGGSAALKPRKVTVYDMEILTINLPFVDIKVSCSAGTYIRTIASELGKRLGTCAHSVSLKRTRSGAFSVESAIRSTEILRYRKNELEDRLISLVDALPSMSEILIPGELSRRIRSGYQPYMAEVGDYDPAQIEKQSLVKLVCDGNLVAIAEVPKGDLDVVEKRLSIKRVFH